jgi:signal transduction histidine kinase
MLRVLADIVELDRQRIERFGAARIPVVPLAPGDAPPARTDHKTWVESSLRWRLPAYALTRALVASAAVATAVAWWWLTIVSLDLATARFTHSYPRYESYRHVHVFGISYVPRYFTVADAIKRSVIGVIGLLLWPIVPRVASSIDITLARSLADWLLGPSTSELSREVGRLAETRAQAVSAADAERRRIERDLHDGFQPQLVNLALNLGLARSRLATDPEAAGVLLERAHEDAKRATEDLRNLVRGIHPSVLDERGLDAAFSALAASSSVRLQIDMHLDRRPPRAPEAIAYFVVAETVTNINKHAGADTATITVSEIEGSLRVVVQDNGKGGARFDPGGGLAGLADRIAAVDGTFSITSPEGGPTWVEARIPCGR